MRDARYTITPEYCGYSIQKQVVRFCGQFLKACDTIEQAVGYRNEAVARRNAMFTSVSHA